MTPPDDVSTRLSEIRERVEAATEGAEKKAFREGYRYGYDCGMGCATYTGYCDAPDLEEAWEESDARSSARSDVPYLLSLVEEVGEALAATDARTVFAFLDRVEEDAGTELMRALGQVRDVALKRDYDAALRDAAQEGAE